jgi:hypothetical protein
VRGAVLAASLVLGVLALAACSPGKSKDAGLPEDLSVSLKPAFQTAFGADAPAAHDIVRDGKTVTLQFSPAAIANLKDGRVALVSRGVETDGCQDCAWALAVHYLSAQDNHFAVTGQWWDVLKPGLLDQPPEAHVREDLFSRPAVQVEGDLRDRGCDMKTAALIALEPAGPVVRARDLSTARSNIPMGALRTGLQVDYDANIVADKTDKAFHIRYRGTSEGDVSYAPSAGGMWAPSGGIKLPDCGIPGR